MLPWRDILCIKNPHAVKENVSWWGDVTDLYFFLATLSCSHPHLVAAVLNLDSSGWQIETSRWHCWISRTHCFQFWCCNSSSSHSKPKTRVSLASCLLFSSLSLGCTHNYLCLCRNLKQFIKWLAQILLFKHNLFDKQMGSPVASELGM